MEKIIVSNYLNESTILKTLARYGSNSFGVRFLSFADLSKKILIENDYKFSKKLINSFESTNIIFNILQDNKFFKDSSSYNDSIKFLESINSLRYLVNDEKEIRQKLNKSEKESNIIDIVDKYFQVLDEKNLIDNIGLIREALRTNNKLDIEINYIQEDNIKPLEKLLLTHCFNNVKEISYFDLFNSKDKDLTNLNIKRCYGKSSEIDYVFNDIISKKIPFDDTLIIVPNSSYNFNLIKEAERYNIPLCFNTKYSINHEYISSYLENVFALKNNNYDIKSLRQLIRSSSFDHFKLIQDLNLNELSIKIDDLIKCAGNLKLDGSKDAENRITNYLKLLEERKNWLIDKTNINENIYKEKTFNDFKDEINNIKYIDSLYKINKIISNLFSFEYCVSFDNNIQNNVVKDKIKEFLDNCKNSKAHLKEFIDCLINNTTISNNAKGIQICSFNNYLNHLSNNIYVLGLDDSFLGRPTQNFLLLDKEYELFENQEHAPTSINQLENLKNKFYNFSSFVNSLDLNVTYIYSFYDELNIRNVNYCSLLINLFMKYRNNSSINDFNNYLNENTYTYKDSLIDYKSNLIKLSKDINHQVNLINYDDLNINLNKTITASVIGKFVECPFAFFITTICGLYIDDDLDTFEFIKANKYGDIVHKCEEYLYSVHPSKEELINKSMNLFNLYKAGHYCLLESTSKSKENEFVDYLNRAYQEYLDNEDSLTYQEYTFKDYKYTYKGSRKDLSINFINIGGRSDRLTINRDQVIISDYKSGRIKVKNSNELYKNARNNLNDYLETYIYAYLFKKEKELSELDELNLSSLSNDYIININYLYTAYSKNDDPIQITTLAFTSDEERIVENILDRIIECINDKNFPINSLYFNDEDIINSLRCSNKDACNYCKLENICKGKVKK